MRSDPWLTPEVVRQLARHNLLRPLIKQQVLAELAAEFPLEEEERRQVLEGVRRERGLETAEALERFLAANLLEESDLRDLAEQPLRLQRALEARFTARAGVRFLSRKSQLDRVVYSLLRVKEPGLARELYLRIAEGEADFTDLAQRYSEGPERDSRGIVGPVPLTQAHPLLAERLRTASVAALLEPFAVESWWLVVRLESLTSATLDATTGRQMAAELLDEWAEEEVGLRLANLSCQRLDQQPVAQQPTESGPLVAR